MGVVSSFMGILTHIQNCTCTVIQANNASEFIVSLTTLILIAITTAVVPLGWYFWQNRKPNFEFTVIKNPFVNEEQRLKEIRIPKGKIILYFAVNVKDKRHYLNCHAWIKFPPQIQVDHTIDYSVLEYGKDSIPRTKNQIGYNVNTPLTGRKYLDGVYFPVVVKIPDDLKGEQKVSVQFWAESIKNDSVEKEITLNIVEDNFSHDTKFFDLETFRLLAH